MSDYEPKNTVHPAQLSYMCVNGFCNRVLERCESGGQLMLHFEEYTARRKSSSNCELVSVVSVG